MSVERIRQLCEISQQLLEMRDEMYGSHPVSIADRDGMKSEAAHRQAVADSLNVAWEHCVSAIGDMGACLPKRKVA